MEYRVAYGEALDRLLAAVSGLIAEGWRPQGGLSVCVVEGSPHRRYYQAMVKGGPA